MKTKLLGKTWVLLLTAMFVLTPLASAAAEITGKVTSSGGYSVGGATVELYRFANVDIPYLAQIEQSLALKETWRNGGATAGMTTAPTGLGDSQPQAGNSAKAAAGGGKAAANANPGTSVRGAQPAGAADAAAQAGNSAAGGYVANAPTTAVVNGASIPTSAQPAGAVNVNPQASNSASVMVAPPGVAAVNTYNIDTGAAAQPGGTQNAAWNGVNAAAAPTVIYSDDFEGAFAWTTGGVLDDWEVAAPGGLGGGGGNPDPAAAVSGAQVLGTDITGDGNYQNSAASWAMSPVVSTAGFSNVRLQFYKWLNVETNFDYGYVEVSNNGGFSWNVVRQYGTFGNPSTDNAWAFVDLDVSAWLDNQPNSMIRFRLTSDPIFVRSGWNLDDVRLVSGLAGAIPATGAAATVWSGTNSVAGGQPGGAANANWVSVGSISGARPAGSAVANANPSNAVPVGKPDLTLPNSMSGNYYVGMLRIDTNGDGDTVDATDRVNYVLIDTAVAGNYNRAFFTIDDNNDYDEGNLNDNLARYNAGNDEDIDVGVGEANPLDMVLTTNFMGGAYYTFSVWFNANPAGGNPDVTATATQWYTGAFGIDTDEDGVVENVDFTISDTTSDGVYDSAELSAGGNFGQGALADGTVSANGANDELFVTGVIMLLVLGTYSFQTWFTVMPAAVAADGFVRATQWYGGTIVLDVNGDGDTVDAGDLLNYVLADTDSNGMYDTLDTDIANGLYGNGNLADAVLDAGTNDDERDVAVSQLGIGTYLFSIRFTTNPATGNPDAEIRALDYFTGGWSVDTNANGAADTVLFAISDTNSDGVYDTMDVSADDGTFGEGNLADDVSDLASNDEREVVVSPGTDALRLGNAGTGYTFTTEYFNAPATLAVDARIRATEWFTGAFAIDTNADGAADAVNVAIADSNSRGLYTVVDVNVDGSYGQGNLGDDLATVAAGNDERDGAGFSTIQLGQYQFWMWFDNNPRGDNSDIRTSAREYYTGTLLLDRDMDGLADDTVNYAMVDTNSNGLYDTIDISTDDGTFGEGAVGDGDAYANDDDRGASGLNTVLNINQFRVTFVTNPPGGAQDVLIRANWYTGSFNNMDVDGSGGIAVGEMVRFSIADTNSDGIAESIDWSSDGAAFGAGNLADNIAGVNNDELDAGNVGAGILSWGSGVQFNAYTFGTGWIYYPGAAGNDAAVQQATWYGGVLRVDLDGDGALDNLNYLLTDQDSNGLYDFLDLSGDDAVYGEVPALLGDNFVARPGFGDDDERIAAQSVLTLGRHSFTVDFDTNPAWDASDVRITARNWYAGTLSADTGADGVLDAVNFALADTNSDALYDTADLSLDDGLYGEGALGNSALGTNNDERLAASPAAGITIGRHAFDIAYTNRPATAADDLSITATEWYTGSFTIDADGDGAADDTLNYALADTDSDGLYDTADLSTDDAVFGEGAPGNGATAANDDERVTGTEVVMGAYNFDFKFDSNPLGDNRDATLTIRQWFTGTVRVEGRDPGYALADWNSDGLFDVVIVDTEMNGNYNGPGDAGGVVTGTLSSGLLGLDYIIESVDSAGGGFTLTPSGGSVGATQSWFVGGMVAGGTEYGVAVSDSDDDGTYDTADFDRDGNKRLDDTGNMEGRGDRVTLGGTDYQILNIGDSGGNVRIIPYTGAALGVALDDTVSGDIKYGTLDESSAGYSLNGDGDATDQFAAIVTDPVAGGGPYTTVYIDLDGDGRLDDETAQRAGSLFTLGANDFEVAAVSGMGTSFSLRQLNGMLDKTVTGVDGSYTLAPPADGYYWLKVTIANSEWGYSVLNETNGGRGIYYDGGKVSQSLALQKRGFDIGGTVTDQSGTALGDVVVEVYGPVGALVMSSLTKTDGTYRVAVAGGSGYDLLFRKIGYITDDGRTGGGTHRDLSVSSDLPGKDVVLKQDVTPPELTIVSPYEGQVLGGVFRISVQATDNFKLEKVRVSTAIGASWLDMLPQGGANFTYDWNTELVPDGYYRVTVMAVDNATLTTTAYRNVYVGNERTPPTVRLLAPREGEFVSGSYAVRLYAADASGLRWVNLTLSDANGSAVLENVPLAERTGGLYEYQLDTVLLADGTYTVSGNAVDMALNRNTTELVSFNIDNHAPLLTVKSPLSGQKVAGSVRVTADANDTFLDAVEYSVDGSGWSNMSSPWNTSATADGSHTVMVRATDLSGRKTEATVTVTVDNTNPWLDIVAPAKDTFTAGMLTVRSSAGDAIGLSRVGLVIASVSGTNRTAVYAATPVLNPSTGFYETLLDTTTFADGTYELSAEAEDGTGHRVNASVRFRIDNHAPTLTVTAPADDAYLRGEIAVQAVAKEEPFRAFLTYVVDGGAPVAIEKALNTLNLTDGRHRITVRATDEAGLYTEKTINVTVDNTVPAISILAPAEGAKEHGKVVVKLSVVEGQGLKFVRTGPDGKEAELKKGSDGLYTVEIDTVALGIQEGDLTITASSENLAGAKANATRKVTVDNRAPEVTMPKTGNAGDIVLKATFKDGSGVKRAWVRIDGGAWKEMSRDSDLSYSYRWKTGEADNGDHSVEVRAEDAYGNEVRQSFGVSVSNAPYSWMVLGVILALAAIGAGLFLMKGRKGKPEEESYQDIGRPHRKKAQEPDSTDGETTLPPPPDKKPSREALPDSSAASEVPAASDEAAPAPSPAAKRGADASMDDILAGLRDKSSEVELGAAESEAPKKGEL